MKSLRTRGFAQFSTSSTQDLSRRYPFPRTTNPTPHEIFHLPSDADQVSVKRRYFELVRIHHPDAATAHGISAQVAERQFKLITAAYTRLQHPTKTQSHRDDIYHSEIQRRRAAHRGVGVRDFEFRRNAAQAEAKASGLWKRDEGLIFMASILAFFVVVYQLASPNPSQVTHKRHKESQKYLSEARTRGKEDGQRRREEIRSWLRDRQSKPSDTVEVGDTASSSQSNTGNITGFGDAVSLQQANRGFETYVRER